MFDVAPSELLLVIIVAIVVIGPKDLPLALRTAGRWIGKVRRMSNHFRSGIETMIREAELQDMEQKWREQNAAIMAQDAGAQTPAAAMDQLPPPLAPDAVPGQKPAEVKPAEVAPADQAGAPPP